MMKKEIYQRSMQTSLQEEQQGYVELLVGALQRFYQEDADELFRGYPIDERAMVGCVARYTWCDRHRDVFNNLEPDVDIEYNKLHETDVSIRDITVKGGNSAFYSIRVGKGE